MFEPLSDVIRLRRLQRNLTQERLAKMAGVSRRQLSLLEDGRNVSLLFLTKIARALELTELPIGDLRLRAAQPELATVVQAAEVVERLKSTLSTWASAAEQIHGASAVFDAMIHQALGTGASAREIVEAAERVATPPAATHGTAGLAAPEPAARATRPKSAARSTARRR